MKIRYATFEINGEKRISFNRNELLSILLSMDSNDKKNGKIEKFIEKLEEILIEEQK